MWTHGFIRRESSFKRFLRNAWARVASVLVMYGHLGKAIALGEGFQPRRVHICYNSLDYSRQRRLRESLTLVQVASARRELFGDERLPIAISLSRLNAFKKIDVLIRAHARLIEQGRKVRLLIVGDGPERATLEHLVDELGVRSSVRFEGECYDEDRLSLLIAASDVSVTPGAIGLTVMHCLAYGVPCITHDDYLDQMPEFEAIIDGRTGGFFRKDDVDDLARVMLQWMNRPAAERAASGRACIAQIERFYRPEIQAAVMLRALRGVDADDLWVAYQPAGAWESTGH
jgi:glycosyltransferase involved in cell wall biosynthesis